jgi:hypothetical protein
MWAPHPFGSRPPAPLASPLVRFVRIRGPFLVHLPPGSGQPLTPPPPPHTASRVLPSSKFVNTVVSNILFCFFSYHLFSPSPPPPVTPSGPDINIWRATRGYQPFLLIAPGQFSFHEFRSEN